MNLPRSFRQEPPRPGNPWADDPLLRSLLARALPPETLVEVEGELAEMGALAGGELYELQLADLPNEPRLVSWSPWGERIDHIEVTALWRRAEELAARRGVVATAYEARHGAFSRLHQFALAHLFVPSTDFYGCPLAMTDGAARTLLASGNQRLIERAVPHLISRDPAAFWTSGQWMTEATGGSDVGTTRTLARFEDGGWRLWGHKWFTSAVASQMALTLARPEGNGRGGKGLALFYLETRDQAGRPNGITVHRLKDKLGTRKLPTAELTLDGARAELVGATTDGVKAIAPMLNVTRTWNAVTASALLCRAHALAADYARRRVAFGGYLIDKALHRNTLAGLEAEAAGALHLAFRVVELLGRVEVGVASAEETALLRLLTPIAKLTTAKQAVAGASEALECFGGAGYVEDTGLPTLLRDAQVLPIWEGTTDVLALDTLRAIAEYPGATPLVLEARRRRDEVKEETLARAAQAALDSVEGALRWLEATAKSGGDTLEAGARRFALTVGRALEVSLATSHAQWALDHRQDPHPLAVALRLAAGTEP
ncbi:MAG TPA: acyl-CoA dehydrogenase family protein [Thermoanaerobaculia bacterium]|nr:acyl-CoA dehydrogenase family protein [Thermoanaerobaculia bacterium]